MSRIRTCRTGGAKDGPSLGITYSLAGATTSIGQWNKKRSFRSSHAMIRGERDSKSASSDKHTIYDLPQSHSDGSIHFTSSVDM